MIRPFDILPVGIVLPGEEYIWHCKCGLEAYTTFRLRGRPGLFYHCMACDTWSVEE